MPELETINVLIADHSPELTALLKETLEAAGFCRADTVHDGESAYRRITEAPPDVLITDLLLPGLDGMSLLRKLKDEGHLPRTIILSAFWNDRLARAARLLGVEDCFAKPCDPAALLRSVRELCGGAVRRCAPDPAVRRALTAFGIPSHLSGYGYLAEGITRILRDRNCLEGITKSLYRDIAKAYGVNPPSVERAIRTAVTKGWERLTPEQRRERFGTLFDGCCKAPSNLEFLSAMAEYIELLSYDNAAAR